MYKYIKSQKYTKTVLSIIFTVIWFFLLYDKL